MKIIKFRRCPKNKDINCNTECDIKCNMWKIGKLNKKGYKNGTVKKR